MFDIGWTEMMVVAVVAILVVGPKDLPKMLRGFGRTMKSIRGLAGDFQKQFEDAVKDADLDDVKNIASSKSFKPLDDIKTSTEAFKKEMQESLAKADISKADLAAKDELPKPAPKKAAAKKPTAKKAASKTAAAKSPTAAKKKAPAKTVAKKTTAKKPVPKKPAPKKVAAAGKSA